MSQLKAIIVEDEENEQQALVALLQLYCPLIFIAGIADNVDDAIALSHKNNPDFLF